MSTAKSSGVSVVFDTNVYEWCGKDLESEDAVHRGLFEVLSKQCIAASLPQYFGDAVEDGDQVCTCATAGVEHVDALIG